jgi:hypothetical protein
MPTRSATIVRRCSGIEGGNNPGQPIRDADKVRSGTKVIQRRRFMPQALGTFRYRKPKHILVPERIDTVGISPGQSDWPHDVRTPRRKDLPQSQERQVWTVIQRERRFGMQVSHDWTKA